MRWSGPGAFLPGFDPRALVLGGTGHIGSAIARRLADAGFAVTATGQRDVPRPNLDGTTVRIVTGDDSVPGIAEGWIAQADLVVDAAAPYPLWLHDRRGHVGRAVARTRRLTAAAGVQGAAFIQISSFTTLQPRSGLLGQGVVRGLHVYFDLKAQVEAVVAEALHSGLKGCVVNPATCFGPYDLKPDDMAFIPMLAAGKVRGLVRHDLNVVDVRDLADVVAAAALRGFPHRQVPVFGHNICLTDLADRICAMAGGSAPRLKVPTVLGLASLYWMETAFALGGRRTPWPSLPMLLVAASARAEPSRQQCDLHPRLRPPEKTLRDAVDWYGKRGQ